MDGLEHNRLLSEKINQFNLLPSNEQTRLIEEKIDEIATIQTYIQAQQYILDNINDTVLNVIFDSININPCDYHYLSSIIMYGSLQAATERLMSKYFNQTYFRNYFADWNYGAYLDEGYTVTYNGSFLRSLDNKKLAAVLKLFGMTTIQQVIDNFPIVWIRKNTELYGRNESPYLRSYISQLGMYLLKDIVHGIPLTPQQKALLRNIHYDIMRYPVTDTQFICFRGLYKDISLRRGDTFSMDRPTSAGFDLDKIIDQYIPFEGRPRCCLAKIIVPVNSHAAFLKFQTQVVFPAGATFRILDRKKVMSVTTRHWDEERIYVYTYLYLGPISDEWKRGLD